MSGHLGEGSDAALVCPPWDVNSTWAGKYLNFNGRTVLKNTVKPLFAGEVSICLIVCIWLFAWRSQIC